MAIDARQLKPAMMILLCVSTSAFAETGDDSLPPPPDARTMNGEAVFQLALVLNHYDTGLVVPVTQREGAWFISGADLLRAGLPPAHVPAGEVNLSTLTSVRAEYDSTAQRLLLTVPGTGSRRGSRLSVSRARKANRTMAAARCSITTFIPTIPNTRAARHRYGTSSAISMRIIHFHRRVTPGRISPVTAGSRKGMCVMTLPY